MSFLNNFNHLFIKYCMKKLLTALLFIVLIVLSCNFYVTKKYPTTYSDSVKKYSEEFNIDKNLIYAVIRCESGFNKDSKSKKGAIGLMQIMPATQNYIMNEECDSVSLYNPDNNIMVGVKYLRYLFNKFNDEVLVLSAYNAGEGNVIKWLNNTDYSPDGVKLKNIPFEETQNYVKRVQSSKLIYQKIT